MTISATKRPSDNFSHHPGARRRPMKTDREGDVVMDGGVSRPDRGGGRGGRGGRGRGRGGINTTQLQREVLKHVADSSRTPTSMRNITSDRPSSLVELRVTGWTNSKASANEDRGISTLISFLERHASKKGSLFKSQQQRGRQATGSRIKKSRVEGDTLHIFIPKEESNFYERLNGYVFAGANITIVGDTQRSRSPRNNGTSPEPANDIKQLLQDFLVRRYDDSLKLLKLNALGTDEKLQEIGMFSTPETQSKFFPAMMKVCDASFQTPQEKCDLIESVSLADNLLPNISVVTSLAQTFPDLKNLDLSGNNFENTSAMIGWRHKFRYLEQLMLNNNPLEQKQPGWEVELVKWFPKLRVLNGIQVRTDEQLAQLDQPKTIPMVKGPDFQDEGGIVQDFILKFFAGFDSDRKALLSMYFDVNSTFSLSVNTSAQRDQVQQDPLKKQVWDAYIRVSRNLKKLTNPNTRNNRLITGSHDISKIWEQLPDTHHPALTSDFHKWAIECHWQPGVPDPTNQYPQGVAGFIISLHGEFEEPNPSSRDGTMLRSFDRTFILGPGGPTGVRVVSDMLTVRAYGGFAAFRAQAAQQVQDQAVLQIQQTVAPVSEQDKLIAEVARITGLTLDASKQCLETSGWNLQTALVTFETHKASLPPTAFA